MCCYAVRNESSRQGTEIANLSERYSRQKLFQVRIVGDMT
jgi:hypothetical protein